MIEVNGLGKSYKVRRAGKVTKVDAVRGVDFTVARGEIFLPGPNGAGKTTLQMLAADPPDEAARRSPGRTSGDR
jgi:ABC-2 type transport system ATP-binding protein